MLLTAFLDKGTHEILGVRLEDLVDLVQDRVDVLAELLVTFGNVTAGFRGLFDRVVLLALRPGYMTPNLAARQSAALDRISNGRLLLNIVTGGQPKELAGDGILLGHDERYAATDEFLHIWRGLLADGKIDFGGKHLTARDAKLGFFGSLQKPYPPLYFGGSSEAAHELAAEQMDVYLTWGEPPAAVKEKLDDIRARAAKHGRTLKFGIRLHVIVRETDEEAWAAADRLISHLDDDTIGKAQASLARFDSVGQQRMAALHGGRRDQLVVAPKHISAIPQRITVIPTNNVIGNLLIRYAAGYSDTN